MDTDAWEALLASEETNRHAMQRAADPDPQSPGEPSRPPPELLRRWWEDVSAICRTWSRDPSQFSLPPKVIFILGKMADELSRGIVPEPINGVLRRGEKAVRYTERRHIGWAVRYVLAARSGLLVDRSPNKSVQEAFGVAKRTVQDWVRTYGEFVAQESEYSTSAPARITAKMAECGAIYRQRGHRSWKAREGRTD